MIHNKYNEDFSNAQKSPKFDGDVVALEKRLLKEYSLVFGDRVGNISSGGALTSAEVMKWIQKYN
jgi:hypothetical protein